MSTRDSARIDAAHPRAGTPAGVLAAQLRSLEGVFASRDWRERRSFTSARGRARQRAYALIEGAEERPERGRLALRLAAAELLVSLSAELADTPEEAGRIVGEIEEILDVESLELALDVLRAPELLALAPPRAVMSALVMLAAFAGVRSVSLWMRDTAERVEWGCYVGGEPTGAVRTLAAQLLSPGEDEPHPRKHLVGVCVGERPFAALIASVTAGTRQRARRLMEELSPLLAAILERDALLTNNAESQRSLTEASERKLTRLGFDLHDGPLQDVAVLAEDLRLLRGQVDGVLGSTHERELVDGRFEDVEAQLVAVDAQLRRLSSEVNVASVLLNKPFEHALRDRAQAFAARTGLQPRVRLTGDMGFVSTSQQIALLNIVQEALSNIREHASASTVKIAVSAGEDGVTASIEDSGRGFELERTMLRAAREGRIGLLAMHERVRLLGGDCRIQSRPGGPTVVSVRFDVYRPIASGPDSAGS